MLQNDYAEEGTGTSKGGYWNLKGRILEPQGRILGPQMEDTGTSKGGYWNLKGRVEVTERLRKLHSEDLMSVL